METGIEFIHKKKKYIRNAILYNMKYLMIIFDFFPFNFDPKFN